MLLQLFLLQNLKNKQTQFSSFLNMVYLKVFNASTLKTFFLLAL
jgi:hypothetical protein